jgi:hypothetical protein
MFDRRLLRDVALCALLAVTGTGHGQEPSNGTVGAQSTVAKHDIFAEQYDKAMARLSEWQVHHKDVEVRAALEENPCATGTFNAISGASAAANSMLEQYGEYYTRHLKNESKLLVVSEQAAVGNQEIRTQIKNLVAAADRQLADVRQRWSTLRESAGADGEPDADVQEALDLLRQREVELRTEKSNLERAMAEIDDGANWTRKAANLAKQRQSLMQAQLRLNRSESFYWDAYYDARTKRQDFRCAAYGRAPRLLPSTMNRQ